MRRRRSRGIRARARRVGRRHRSEFRARGQSEISYFHHLSRVTWLSTVSRTSLLERTSRWREKERRKLGEARIDALRLFSFFLLGASFFLPSCFMRFLFFAFLFLFRARLVGCFDATREIAPRGFADRGGRNCIDSAATS